VQACFTVLSHAAAELHVVFAEAGAMDFVEVAQIAQSVLEDADGFPTEAAQALADGIHHLLVDEFQDTSRRQHRLLASLAAAWSDAERRTLFVVGDPKQSIYFFRDADAELFPRVTLKGLESTSGPIVSLEAVSLTTNFRTDPTLVHEVNRIFEDVFAVPDGSGVMFTPAAPARLRASSFGPRLGLHLEFMPRAGRARTPLQDSEQRNADQLARETALKAQLREIVAVIRGCDARMAQARAAGTPFRIAVLGRTRTVLAQVAGALRAASIPFRAIELEQLKSRPEVLDALALARALHNHQDRVAWLGVLRAPWCGLGLDDLYIIAGTDDERSLRSIPVLLAERIGLLTAEGQVAARRILGMVESFALRRKSMPTATLGTLLEQVWEQLGGPFCAGRAERANLDLLWQCLDGLPEGAQDLFGTGLDAALESLTALPDPAASSDYGVQLMTIHKSKGLEFEVVMVPELQARANGMNRKMLSWLERGLAEPDGNGEITEFLVAPLQTKGADRGRAKLWVDRESRKREQQEMRRILYVAATRAREELHLFARPEYKESDGQLELAMPRESLLATAWPGLRQRIEEAFDTWKSARAGSRSGSANTIDTLAAAAESNLFLMPSATASTPIRRLPSDFSIQSGGIPSPRAPAEDHATGQTELYRRHEGGQLSRALGTAVHALFEGLAKLRTTKDWPAARAALALLEGRIVAQSRSAGFAPAQAHSIAQEAMQIALASSNNPHGQWILGPHAEAFSESAWEGHVQGALRGIRVDRVFLAGDAPLVEGQSTLWIIDYKTAQFDGPASGQSLQALRTVFAPQLEAYATVLRPIYRDVKLHAGLYYPRMQVFDWWKMND
ncbi:MAG: 3'-5' exonuclease, partial [Terracidiphilus sp.]